MKTYFSCKLENGGKTGFYIIILVIVFVKRLGVVYLRFHQNRKLLRFSRRRRLDDILTTSHMRRSLKQEKVTSSRRRCAILLLVLKFPIKPSGTTAASASTREQSSHPRKN